MYYFKVDGDVIARLGAAQSLAHPHAWRPTKAAAVEAQFALKIAEDPRLKEFAARISMHYGSVAASLFVAHWLS